VCCVVSYSIVVLIINVIELPVKHISLFINYLPELTYGRSG
jgi:hypothetical protein